MPIIVLAGGARHRGAVPRGLSAGDMLDGAKGALRLPNGRLLVAEVCQRFVTTGRFASPIVIGPRHAYEEIAAEFEIVNAVGTLATSLARTVQTIRKRIRPDLPIAVTACDILPTAAEIITLLDSCYDPVSDCVFWGQMVRADPGAMGASGWKPAYGFNDGAGSRPGLYPGHLVILRPEAMRFQVAIRLLHLAYSYRNKPLSERVLNLLLRALTMLIWQDIRNLARRQFPTLTASIPFHCLRAYFEYTRGELSLNGFEQAFTKTFVHRDYHHRCAGRPTVFSVTDILAFAKDLDTRAELDEAVRALACVSG